MTGGFAGMYPSPSGSSPKATGLAAAIVCPFMTWDAAAGGAAAESGAVAPAFVIAVSPMATRARAVATISADTRVVLLNLAVMRTSMPLCIHAHRVHGGGRVELGGAAGKRRRPLASPRREIRRRLTGRALSKAVSVLRRG
ncbi:hypothetical protein SMICM304S_04990 [Streptomyces microflavus]